MNRTLANYWIDRINELQGYCHDAEYSPDRKAIVPAERRPGDPDGSRCGEDRLMSVGEIRAELTRLDILLRGEREK